MSGDFCNFPKLTNPTIARALHTAIGQVRESRKGLTFSLKLSFFQSSQTTTCSFFACTNECNTTNACEDRLPESVRSYLHLNDYYVSPLSVTAGFSTRLWMWPFGTVINTLAFRWSRTTCHTNRFVSSMPQPLGPGHTCIYNSNFKPNFIHVNRMAAIGLISDVPPLFYYIPTLNLLCSQQPRAQVTSTSPSFQQHLFQFCILLYHCMVRLGTYSTGGHAPLVAL